MTLTQTKTYLVSTVVPRPMGGYDMTLRDPDELDDEGLNKYVGGFCYIEGGLPPIEGSTVEVTNTLGTKDCIIEWDRGRLIGTKYKAKTPPADREESSSP